MTMMKKNKNVVEMCRNYYFFIIIVKMYLKISFPISYACQTFINFDLCDACVCIPTISVKEREEKKNLTKIIWKWRWWWWWWNVSLGYYYCLILDTSFCSAELSACSMCDDLHSENNNTQNKKYHPLLKIIQEHTQRLSRRFKKDIFLIFGYTHHIKEIFPINRQF